MLFDLLFVLAQKFPQFYVAGLLRRKQTNANSKIKHSDQQRGHFFTFKQPLEYDERMGGASQQCFD